MKNNINHILIFRQVVGNTWTRGQLYLNGVFIGYTLEDTLRPLPIKVASHTAITDSTFYARKYHSNRFGDCIAIDDVPMFEHIRIHGGNDDSDTRGCILLGHHKDDGVGRIWDCRSCLDKLLDAIDDAQPIVVTLSNAVGIV